jgi:hypothetical protein
VKHLRFIPLIVALGMLMAVPAVTTAASAYNGYIACAYKTAAPHATSCSKKGKIGAFFRSKHATVKFKTCVKFPDGELKCTRKSTAQEGLYYVNKLTVGSKGTLKVKWKVDGAIVAKYTIQVT